MNPFQKNPFIKNENKTRIVGYNPEFQEKNKLENIKLGMTKLKIKPIEQKPIKKNNMTVNEKIEAIKNINGN
jgi:hypothetical protein